MNDVAAGTPLPTASSAVAPHRQCIGCGFDIAGLAIMGCCSECGRPVLETVERPLLRDDPARFGRILWGVRIFILCALMFAVSMLALMVMTFGNMQASSTFSRVELGAGCCLMLLIMGATTSTWLLMSGARWRWRRRLTWIGATVALPFGLLLTGAFLSSAGFLPAKAWIQPLLSLPLTGLCLLAVPLTGAVAAITMATDNFGIQRTGRLVKRLAAPWAIVAMVVFGSASVVGNLVRLKSVTPHRGMMLSMAFVLFACLAVTAAYTMLGTLLLWRLARAASRERLAATKIIP